MVANEVEIINKLGLHARAAAKLTALATEYKSEIWMSRGDKKVNAKSIMGVMMLAAAKGSSVRIEADGLDEREALRALASLIANRFGEGE
ncbi:MAG: HPr family phosphocarrier protein [Burkholderiales bacterium]